MRKAPARLAGLGGAFEPQLGAVVKAVRLDHLDSRRSIPADPAGTLTPD
jgi:hypothetical protein